MSMFSQIQSEPTCTTVDECVQNDKLSNNLWTWAHRLETLGMALFVFLLVYGIYAAVQGATVEVVKGTYYQRVETEFDFMAFLVGLINWALYAFIEYCLYHVVALLIGALAGIYQNTKAAARLQEYHIRKGEGTLEAGKRSSPEAGEKASSDVGEDRRVTCPQCGTRQHAVREKCYQCGATLPIE